ncbi:MAG: DUF4380 domain-containing protein [Candidatus Zipacnadales bacterium]
MRALVWVCVAGVVMLTVGCGGDVDRAQPPPSQAPPNPAVSLATESVEVTQVDYHGWQGLRMSNGLIVLVAVPEIGGRIMEYKLNGHPFLWTNPEEYGRLYEPPKTETDRQWHNFGGYKLWPAPQSEWGGPPDPIGSLLDGGKWTGEIVTDHGQIGEIRLISPPDPSVTGLQITRTVRLFAGSTRVEVAETLSNVSDHDIRWSAWDVTQVPGSLSSNSKADQESRIYFPLNPQTKMPGGYVKLLDDSAGDAQWEVLRESNLMRVSYRGALGKIGADSQGGWIAHVDEIHNMAYIKRFDVAKLAEYPDRGSTVEVFTSNTHSYMEVEVLSELIGLKPGESYTVTRNWYAAAVPGPIISTSKVGAVNTALAIKEVEGKLEVTGVFGVFAEGKAVLASANAEGKVLDEIVTFPASPIAPLAIEEQIQRPKSGELLVLELKNANGSPLGRLASIELPHSEPSQVTAKT